MESPERGYGQANKPLILILVKRAAILMLVLCAISLFYWMVGSVSSFLDETQSMLLDIVRNKGGKADLIPEYRRIYLESGAIAVARCRIEQDIAKAKRELHRLPSSRAQAMLEWFADMLLNRTF